MDKKVTGILYLTFMLLSQITFSAVIQGNEPDYAGQQIVFKIYTDPITKNETELFKIIVGSDGVFKAEIDISKPVYCHAEFGVYKGLIILEPNSDLTLKLPPFREKTLPESKNPYFKPLLLWLRVSSNFSEEVNQLVAGLEARYIELTNKYLNELYIRQSEAWLDTVATRLEKEFGRYNIPELQNQLLFKIKLLKADVNQVNQLTVFEGVKPGHFSYKNPAFTDLFNLVFNNRLSFEANDIKGADLRKAVGRSDIAFIKKFFIDKYHLDEGFADFVVLKLLHDAYYSNQFPKDAIIKMLDSPVFQVNSNSYISKTANNIKEKLLFLSLGSQAPVICLNGLDGTQHCSDKSEKYTYLIFADTEMLVCREHLKYLTEIEKKYKDQLDIFIVLKYAEKEKIEAFFNDNKISGTIVLEKPGNKEALEYRIKSYPAAFLLDQNNKVVKAPAKNPLDGFEQEFASLQRAEQIRKFRNQR